MSYEFGHEPEKIRAAQSAGAHDTVDWLKELMSHPGQHKDQISAGLGVALAVAPFGVTKIGGKLIAEEAAERVAQLATARSIESIGGKATAAFEAAKAADGSSEWLAVGGSQVHRTAMFGENVTLEGHNVIGANSVIGPNSLLKDNVTGSGIKLTGENQVINTQLGDHAALDFRAKVGIPNLGTNEEAITGIRTFIGNDTRIGNLTSIGRGTLEQPTLVKDGAVIGDRSTIVGGSFIDERAVVPDGGHLREGSYVAPGQTWVKPVLKPLHRFDGPPFKMP